MKVPALLIFAGLAVCALCVPSVRFFSALKVEPTKSKLGTFSFKNCVDPSKEIGVVNSLIFGPDPLVFPGPLNVTFSITAKGTVDAPLKADVYLARKMADTWLKIPCISQIGSCSYDDLCEILANVQCPEPFVENGVPCNCPFRQGNYSLPTTEFDVDVAIFPPGDYHGQANLTYNGQLVGCYDLYVSFG